MWSCSLIDFINSNPHISTSTITSRHLKVTKSILLGSLFKNIYRPFFVLSSFLEATVEDSLSVVTSFTRSSIQQNAIEQLIFRLVGNQSSRFHVTVNSGLTDESKEVFEVSVYLFIFHTCH